MGKSKVCTRCQSIRPAEDYLPSGRVARTVCKECLYSDRRKKWSSSYKEFLKRLCQNSKSSRSKQMEWSITADHLIGLWESQDGKCALSGAAMTHHRDGSGRKEFNASIDRIDQEKGYTPQNIHLVCYRVNILRHDLPVDMFYWWVKTIYEHSCD